MNNTNCALLPPVHENVYTCSMSKRELQNDMKIIAIWPTDGRWYDASITDMNGDSLLVCYKDDDITRRVKDFRTRVRYNSYYELSDKLKLAYRNLHDTCLLLI